MKTISVRDAALALDISPRAVLYRREKGQLKGQLVKNDHGVPEYRIYPNKEIIEGLKRIGSPLIGTSEPFQEADIVDVGEATCFEPDDSHDMSGEFVDPKSSWSADPRTPVGGVAEELWQNIINRFLEKLEQKDQLIGEMRNEIEDKERRLKLLPDLEKRALEAEEERKRTELERQRAEAERKNAEIKALEVEALKKQINALQERVDTAIAPEIEKQLLSEKAAKEIELHELKTELEAERRSKLEEIQILESKLASVEEYKQVADDAQRKIQELQKIIEERAQKQESQETAALEEIKQLQEEKNAAVLKEVAALSAKLEQAQKPWWKKFFGVE